METSENVNAIWRTDIAILMSKTNSKSLKLQKVLQKEKLHSVPQINVFARLRTTFQSVNTNIDSLASDMNILGKHWNDSKLRRNIAKAQQALLAAQYSKLAQKLEKVRKHVATNRRSLPEYCSEFSSKVASEFQEFCRRLLDYARKNVQSHQRGKKVLITEALASFEQTFNTFRS